MRISSRKKYKIKETTEHTNYEADKDTLVPSVTTVLKVINKEALMQWANSLGWKRKSVTKELNDASLIGTMAHEYVESYIFDDRAKLHNLNLEIDTLPYELNEKVRHSITSFMSWWDENKQFVKPIACELEMCCDYYGGTLDLVCLWHGKLSIFDFKTSGDFHPTMYMQLAAYANMYEELFGKKIEEVAILRLDKKEGRKAKLKTIEEVPGHNRDQYYMAFLSALNLYRAMHVINMDWGEE